MQTIYPTSLWEHRAPTKFLHRFLSWASHWSSFHVFPASFLSSSIVLLQVPCGLPLCLCPWGFHVRAMKGWRDLFIRRTWPSHLHLLLLTSSTIQFIPVLLATSLLVTLSSHQMCRIRLRHRPSNPLNLLIVDMRWWFLLTNDHLNLIVVRQN